MRFFKFLFCFFCFCCLMPSRFVLGSEFPHRITCIIPSRSETVFWKEIDESIHTAAEEFQFELTMIYTENSDPSIAMDLNDAIETAILTDTEAIITSYTKADSNTDELLKQARAAGIYVIFLDCDGPEELRDLYVGIDNEAAGYALGMYVKEHLQEGEKALLYYSLSNQNSQNLSERTSGIKRAFASSPDSIETFEFSNYNDMTRIMELEDYLLQNDSITALIATTEHTTVTAAQLFSRLSLPSRIQLYGFDQSDETMELLETGQLQALVCQQHYEMGYQSVVLTNALLEGKVPDSDFYKIDFLILFENESKVDSFPIT